MVRTIWQAKWLISATPQEKLALCSFFRVFLGALAGLGTATDQQLDAMILTILPTAVRNQTPSGRRLWSD